MLKTGEIEVAYYSKQAFYTIKGVKFAKTMTPDHTGMHHLTSLRCSIRDNLIPFTEAYERMSNADVKYRHSVTWLIFFGFEQSC
jgi:hypothetical protein